MTKPIKGVIVGLIGSVVMGSLIICTVGSLELINIYGFICYALVNSLVLELVF